MTIPDDKLPVLPEPVGHQIICYGRYQSFVVRDDVADEVACKLREQSDPEADFRAVFTADQLRTAQREAIEAVMPKGSLLLNAEQVETLRELVNQASESDTEYDGRMHAFCTYCGILSDSGRVEHLDGCN